MSQWKRPGWRAQTLNVIEVLNLANGERVALKVEKDWLLARGAPSAWQRPSEDVRGNRAGAPKEGAAIIIHVAQSSLVQFDDPSLLALSITRQSAAIHGAMLLVLM